MPNRLSQFWQELKRRKVIRVITVYAAAAFVILGLVDIIAEPLKLPTWLLPVVIVLLSVGLLIAIILSWIYDIHPEGGIVKTKPAHKVKPEEEHPSSNSWKIASYISFVVIVGLVVLNIIPRTGRRNLSETLDKSIAVLPFESLSKDKELQYQADGVMDAILLHLSRIEDLRVMARTSVEQYRDTKKTVSEICEELDMGYVLEGSFQKSGDQIRLIVQLIQSGKKGHMWANSYDRDWKDIFAVQSEVAQAVAGELQAVISPELKQRIESEPTENMQAYNLYLQGRNCIANYIGREGFDQSIQFYKQALEMDPDFALAYSALAASYSTLANFGILPRKEVVGKAREAAQSALNIDNTLGEAHAEGHFKYSSLLRFVGRHDEGIAEVRRAMVLDPLSDNYWLALGRSYMYAGYFDLSIEELRRFLSNYPDNDWAHRFLSMTYLQKGMVQEAMDELFEVNTKGKEWWDGYIYGMAGETEKVKEVLEYQLELAKTQFISPTAFTVIYARLGEEENDMVL